MPRARFRRTPKTRRRPRKWRQLFLDLPQPTVLKIMPRHNSSRDSITAYLKVKVILHLVKIWKICTPVITHNRDSADQEQIIQISVREIALQKVAIVEGTIFFTRICSQGRMKCSSGGQKGQNHQNRAQTRICQNLAGLFFFAKKNRPLDAK